MWEGTHKDGQHFRIVWQINWQIITINLSLLVSVFNKANGLAFVSGPDKITINATTGSNQTFTWKLNISQEHKQRELKAQFGPWNRRYKLVNRIITFNQKLSGNTTVTKSAANHKSRRLYWVGDLKRDYYIAFQLVNIQRDDAGDYGVKLRVDTYSGRPLTLQSWFTLKVEVRKKKKQSYSFFARSIEACKKTELSLIFSVNCACTHPIWAIRKCTRHTSFDIVFFYAQITKQFALCCQIGNPFWPNNVPWKFCLVFYYGEFKRRLSYNAHYPCTNSGFNFIVHGTELFGWIDVLIYKHKTSQETSYIFLTFELYKITHMEKYFHVYYIHFEITGYPCNLIGYQQCDLFLNRTIFCSKSHLFQIASFMFWIASFLF